MAVMTLLQLAQEFARRRGLPIPSGVTGAQDDTVTQMWGLLNEGIADISDRFEWQQLRTRYTFQHAGSTGYTALDLSEAGPIPGYKAILNGTLWDTLGRRQVFGPYNPLTWEAMINLQVSQAVYNFTIYGSALRIYPVPTVVTPDQFAMEYITSYGAFDPDLNTPTQFFNTDTSYCRMPSTVMLQDLKWRWNYNKGLPYAEDQRTLEEMLLNLQGRDPAPDIQMDGNNYDQIAMPGLYVAAGSWNIT